MSVDLGQFIQVFFDETAEHLANMESLLLALDLEAPDVDDLNAIFRAAHSMKGGAGTFGFPDIAEVTHVLETLLDRMRKSELRPTGEMVDVLLEAGDVIKGMLDSHRGGVAVERTAADAVQVKLARLSGGAAVTNAPARAPSARVEPPAPVEYAHKIQFTSDAAPALIENLLSDLRDRGVLQIVPTPKQRATRGKKAKSQRYALELTTVVDEAELRDLFSFVVRPDDLTIETDEHRTADADDAGYGFFTDIPPLQDEAPPQDPGYGFFQEITLPAQDPDPGYGFFPGAPAAPVQTAAAGRRMTDSPEVTEGLAGRRTTDKVVTTVAGGDSSSIRVGVDKVDQLINLVGELVITQAMLTQTGAALDPAVHERLLNGLDQLARNTRDLQDSVMSIRMLPIAFVFNRFPRLVRELAGKLNKRVELRTFGESTELDKGLIERVADPLTHLVRNSLDHGIESPSARLAAGKPEAGTIELRAYHQSGNIIIEVADDGAGLSRERILAKARSRGMEVPDSISDQEVWQLIFEAGFSTAEQVTDVSGRGVGMDVVRRNIQELGGRVEIESALGAGTRMRVRLPLTLAILDGMSIAVGNEVFIIPLTLVVESLQPDPSHLHFVSGKGRVVQVRGEYLQVLALHEVIGGQPRVTEPSEGILVIVEATGRKVALFVDELVGQHQVVIKSLESNFRKVPGFAGATIMGDGTVAFILDIPGLVRLAGGDTANRDHLPQGTYASAP